MAKVLWAADRRIEKDNGDPAADGTISFRLADTATTATVYADKELTTPFGSTIAISSDGYLDNGTPGARVAVYGADDVGYDARISSTGVNGGAAWTIPDVGIADSSVASAAYRTGFKNALSNGNLASWSGLTTFSNISGDNVGVETADGFFFAQPSAASNAVSQQTADSTGVQYGYRMGRPAASTSTNKLRVWKLIDPAEVYRLRGQTVTISFSAKVGANFSAAALTCKLATGTTAGESGDGIEAGSWGGFAQPINQSQAITTSIVRYSFSATLGATIKEAGIQFSYTGIGTAGANDWVQIEDIQVEISDTATAAEDPPELLGFLLTKYAAALRGGPVVLPQGRLCLTTATPYPSVDETAKATVFYSPAVGSLCPIYNGSRFVPTVFAEVSQTLADNTKSPAAAAAGKCYDMFVWNDSGTIRCTRGPLWDTGGGSTTARGTGAGSTELERVGGIYLNKVAITNGPAANRGTYVGTIFVNGSTQLAMMFRPTPAAGGSANDLNVWNAYNQMLVTSINRPSDDSWTYTTATLRAWNNNASNNIGWVCGLPGGSIKAYASIRNNNATASVSRIIGIGYDSASAIADGCLPSSVSLPGTSADNVMQVTTLHRACEIGRHNLTPLEYSGASGTTTWYGDAGAATLVQAGTVLEIWM